LTINIKFDRMREIKFRAWTNNCWINRGMVYDYQDTTYVESFGFNNDELPLMQFTGLKDKNGKEIYEGDILTYNGITSNGNRIIREVNYNAANARFQSGMYLLTQSIELSEIIGNIHENPELLNQ